MMMKTSIITIALSLSAIICLAQNIEDNQLKVVKEFETEVFDAKPIAYDYRIDEVKIPTGQVVSDSLQLLGAYSPDLALNVSPVAYQMPADARLHRSYLSLHKGTINKWNAQGSYIHRVDNYFTVGVSGYYDQWANDAIKDKMATQAGGRLHAKYYLTDKVYTQLHIGTESSKWGQYSDNTVIEGPRRDTINRKSTSVGLALKSYNTGAQSWNYSLSAQHHLTKHIGSDEKSWDVNAGIIKRLGTSWSAGANSTLQQSTIKENGQVVTNQLFARYNAADLSMRIGASHNAQIGVDKSFFPYLEMVWNIDPSMQLTAAVEESYALNTLTDLSQQVPYISPTQVAETSTTQSRSYSLALASTIYKLTINGQLSYNDIKNDLNWSSTHDSPTIHIGQIDYQSASINLSGAYAVSKELSAGLSGHYSHYLSDEALYHRPVWSVSPSVSVSLLDSKLSLEAKALINGQQSTGMANDAIVKSGIRKNVSTQINYRPIRNVSIYLNGDNLLNDDYTAIGQYGVFERNLSGGVLVKF